MDCALLFTCRVGAPREHELVDDRPSEFTSGIVGS